MGWSERDPYKYYPERGLYYHEVWPKVYCGSQPQNQHDIDELAALLSSDGTILSLQQDRDLRHWGVDLHSLQARASERSLQYLRRPVRPAVLTQISRDLEKRMLAVASPGFEALALDESNSPLVG